MYFTSNLYSSHMAQFCKLYHFYYLLLKKKEKSISTCLKKDEAVDEKMLLQDLTHRDPANPLNHALLAAITLPCIIRIN